MSLHDSFYYITLEMHTNFLFIKFLLFIFALSSSLNACIFQYFSRIWPGCHSIYGSGPVLTNKYEYLQVMWRNCLFTVHVMGIAEIQSWLDISKLVFLSQYINYCIYPSIVAQMPLGRSSQLEICECEHCVTRSHPQTMYETSPDCNCSAMVVHDCLLILWLLYDISSFR